MSGAGFDPILLVQQLRFGWNGAERIQTRLATKMGRMGALVPKFRTSGVSQLVFSQDLYGTILCRCLVLGEMQHSLARYATNAMI